MKQIPFVWFFTATALGILTATNLQPDWFFTLTSFFIIFSISFLFELRSSLNGTEKIIKNYLPIGLFFTMGLIVYSMSQPTSNFSHIQNQYLEGDRCVGIVRAINPAKNTFRKTEMEVIQLIRFKDTIPVSGKIIAFVEDSINTLQRGDVCYFLADLDSIKNNNNPGEFDAIYFWHSKSIYHSAFIGSNQYLRIGKAAWRFMDLFEQLRDYFSSLINLYVSGDENGVAKALILGDRSALDKEITRKFGNTGAMHVLAVSGLHVSILVQIIHFLLGKIRRISAKQALFLALILVWIYAALTGLSASVVRSALMFTVLAGSSLLDRDYNSFNSLAFSGVLLLIWNPLYLFDIGFQLSYLAMLGIFTFYKPLSTVFYSKFKWIQSAIDGTMVGIAAQIVTVPLTLYYFHQFPNYFVLTNLGLMVISFLVLAIGIALFALGELTFVAKYIGWLLGFSIWLMLLVIEFVDSIPGAVSMGFVLAKWEVIALFILIGFLFYAITKKVISGIYIGLFSAFILVCSFVYLRFDRMTDRQICFLHAKNPAFIVKTDETIYCFYSNREKDEKEIRFLAESFQKVYPGKIHFLEVSQKKSTRVSIDKQEISVEKVRGGLQIELRDSVRNQENYFFLATKDNFENPKGKIIYSPWMEYGNTGSNLTHGAIQFWW